MSLEAGRGAQAMTQLKLVSIDENASAAEWKL